jgi:hypothetical protein
MNRLLRRLFHQHTGGRAISKEEHLILTTEPPPFDPNEPVGPDAVQRVQIEHGPIQWDQIGKRPTAGEEEIPLEPWLGDRIAAHADLVRERAVRGDAWFFQALGQWDVRNTYELETKVAPDLVDGYYRGDGTPGYVPGHEEAYYDRQLAWLTDTLRKLRDGSQQKAVTPATIEHNLGVFVNVAGQLLRGNVTQAQVDDWAEKVGEYVRATGPKGEEAIFLVEGNELDPRAELRAKVARIQVHILPKVRAGEWKR